MFSGYRVGRANNRPAVAVVENCKPDYPGSEHFSNSKCVQVHVHAYPAPLPPPPVTAELRPQIPLASRCMTHAKDDDEQRAVGIKSYPGETFFYFQQQKAVVINGYDNPGEIFDSHCLPAGCRYRYSSRKGTVSRRIIVTIIIMTVRSVFFSSSCSRGTFRT